MLGQLSLCLLVFTYAVSGFQLYQFDIPNGNNVPHPCLIAQKWQGVGHMNASGSGVLNAFGQDFAAAGHVWTNALCHKDSDNDGLSNGQELGDPHCRFTPTGHNNLENPSGHPGICEPVGSTACRLQINPC